MGGSLWDRCVELTVYLGERALVPVHRWIRRRSLVGSGPFFDRELLPWVEQVEAQWQVVREEVQRLLADRDALPNFQDISADQITITDDDRWKTVFLYGYGFRAELGCELCPRTAEIVRSVPGMTTAMFSILSPGKHIEAHSGPYSGVLRYQLGLIVPREGERCRIRVGEETRHWEEGRSLIFDDTFDHEVWNDTEETRVILFLDVIRPLPFPESVVNRLLLKLIALSPFVLDARRRQEAWERSYRERMALAVAAG